MAKIFLLDILGLAIKKILGKDNQGQDKDKKECYENATDYLQM